MVKKLSEINYFIATSVNETVNFMYNEGGNVRILAGNTLLNELGKRDLLNEVAAFVDISSLPLKFVNYDSKTGDTRIGAISTFTELLKEPLLDRPQLFALRQALSVVRPVQVRNAATIGGCIGAGLPFLDVPVALLALDARINVLSNDGSERLEEYSNYCSTLSGGIASGQLITEVKLPSFDASALSRYARFSTTGLGEAIVNVAVMIIPDEAGKMKRAHVAVGGSGVDMGRMKETEASLSEERMEQSIIERAIDSILKEVQVTSDLNGSADFKKHVLATTFERVLRSIGGQGS